MQIMSIEALADEVKKGALSQQDVEIHYGFEAVEKVNQALQQQAHGGVY